MRLPVQLQRAMAAEAEATREARAKVPNEPFVSYTVFVRISSHTTKMNISANFGG